MLVSVLMPVYNGENYLSEAVESILNQTFRDFELIIIDDGSTDRTAEILAEYERRDMRVRLYSQARKGLIATLNRGIELSRGRYIARMDADDVSYPTRLEKQVAFLEAHLNVGVCGTWRVITGGRVIRTPVQDGVIRSYLIFDTLLARPTVMMRKTLFETGIRYPAYEHAEDFGLWVQLADHTHFANLPEVLLYYRSHPGQVARKNRAQQMEAAGRVREAQLRRLGLRQTAEELEIHQAIAEWRFRPDHLFLMQSQAWLLTILRANQEKRIYPESEFSQVLAQRWFEVCNTVATRMGLKAGIAFWRSPLRSVTRLSVKKTWVLAIRCLIGDGLNVVRRASDRIRRAGRSHLDGLSTQGELG
jgi:glycosyltransferase involved in cell wall biosynthesis